MEPLYKRYIPPKKTVTPAPTAAPSIDRAQTSLQEDAPKPRKRVRTDEEIAERRAKKLKRKGVLPAEAELNPQLRSDEHAVTTVDHQFHSIEATQTAKEPQGEFAHVKNTKKRHKLEKEARKARKDAERSAQPIVHHADLEEINTEPGKVYHTPHNGSPGPPKTKANDEDRDRFTRNLNEKNEDGASLSERRGIEGARLQHAEDGVVPNHEAASRLNGRRHKLETALRSTNSSKHAEEEDTMQKHSSVMKKFQRSTSAAERNQTQEHEVSVRGPTFDVPTVRDLVIPEPAVSHQLLKPESNLPAWLAKPISVQGDQQVPFASLKLAKKTLDQLSKLGLKDALPVQQALIPALLEPGEPGSKYLPGTGRALPDVAVSAPTGSGKTIAYLLPIFESLKKNAFTDSLRVLVIVPTRELVVQVAAVSESLAKGSSIRIGIATGAGRFRDEAAKLIKRGRKYDPDRYRVLLERAHRQNYHASQDSLTTSKDKGDTADESHIDAQVLEDTVNGLVDHVPTYESAVDILITTPGRLLEHMAKTTGFNLSKLRWLVLDEADKILDQENDGLIDNINEALSKPRPTLVQDARERYLRDKCLWDEHQERHVRKIMLSATMTRDVSKLVQLKLRRPLLIVVRGDEQHADTNDCAKATTDTMGNDDETSALPPLLSEYSVHVGDGSAKPLYLVEVLRRVLTSASSDMDEASSLDSDSESETASHSSTDASSDSPSDDESSTESISSAEDEDVVESPSELRLTNSSRSRALPEIPSVIHPDRAAILAKSTDQPPTVLIFTSSTETTNRLSYMLKQMQPQWAGHIATMTRSNPKASKIHSQASPSDPTITISTDRAGRGLDMIGNRPVTHVIQYDVPRSATSYIHRVGRTARAGRMGDAWTLFTHSEARWFVNTIVKSKKIRRSGNVEKIKLYVDSDAARQKLREVVQSMRAQAFGGA